MTWQQRAACAGRHELFDETGSPADHAAAKALCATCPVIDACRAEANTTGAIGMIWAGVLRGERHWCKHCGKLSDGTTGSYCSNTCREAARIARHPDQPPRGQCVQCGTRLSGQQVLYCSRQCGKDAKKQRLRDLEAAEHQAETAVAVAS